MAEHLASIFGTEKDRVNCPFYFKIGACRHGDRCSRLHTKPTISPTLLLSNMYQRPDMLTPGVDPQAQSQSLDPRKIQDHFEDFYEDLFEELSKYGDIESLNICDNLADHMVGNVYVQFREEEHAANALRNLNGRFYAGRPIIVDFSPVTDFREATCRQYEENVCNRGGYCNFMHLKKISRELRRQLFGRNRRRRSRSRSHSPERHRGHEERPHGGRGLNRREDDREHHNERGRRPRSRSPARRGGRSSPGGRRNRSPVRESSAERRAKIEKWNREKEQTESGGRGDSRNPENDRDNSDFAENGGHYDDAQHYNLEFVFFPCMINSFSSKNPQLTYFTSFAGWAVVYLQSVLVEFHFNVVEASRKLLDLCTMRKTDTSIQGEMALNHLSYVDSTNGIQIEFFGILSDVKRVEGAATGRQDLVVEVNLGAMAS
ncbi:hypothetical protein POTOM_025370 [Populus tomentosa]|uniref:Uncharacterized protein n=1 Tax=Populus tomentosa TaxID=118781 RepID=A0A8X7ZH13_POPTO|nr:hypothetical protein POTOM_025370 [Populus tomentosa]